jgi:hypothetical protein
MHKFRGAGYLSFLQFLKPKPKSNHDIEPKYTMRFITDIDKFYRFGQYSEPHKKYAMVVKFVDLICTPNARFYYSFLLV